MSHVKKIPSINYSIMSRRKQSNPKPLLKRDDEEVVGDENNAAPQNEIDGPMEEEQSPNHCEIIKSESASPRCDSPEYDSKILDKLGNCIKLGEKRPLEIDQNELSLSPIPTAKIMPTLRLNTALCSDPANNPDAKEIKSIHVKNEENKSEDEDDIEAQISTSIKRQHITQAKAKLDSSSLVNPLVAKTLEMSVGRPNVFFCNPCSIRFSSASTLEAHQTYYCTHRENADEVPQKNPITNADGTTSEPPTKAIKTGKQYACTQCSYSADKKVSLNRHMRMHQTSPAPSSTTSNGGDENPVSQILPQQLIGPALPQVIDRYCSECDIRFSSTKTYRAHKQHYCSSRHRDGQLNNVPASSPSAVKSSTKSGSQSPPETVKTPPATQQQPFLTLPTNPIIIIPYSLIRNASIFPGPLTTIAPNVANPDSACFILQNGSLQPIAYSLASMSAGPNTTPQPSTARNTPSVQSLNNVDHKTKTNSNTGASTGEVLKVVNKGTGKEPTTPLDLSVRRSPLSNPRERSISMSSAMSAEHLRMEFESMMEGKENVSNSSDSITPEQIVCAPSLPGSPPLTPSPKRRSQSPRSGTISISPNSALAHQLLMRPLLPADIALRLSDPSLNITPQLLVKQSMELALRLSSASSNDGSPKQISPRMQQPSTPTQPINSPNKNHSPGVNTSSLPPQIFVKQGVSKCKECNIVFCKYENYLAHKKHYCSARNAEDTEGNAKASPPISPQATSPSAIAYQQLICVACGIKFTSWDNLSAHQMYYCPKRQELQAVSGVNNIKERCAKCKTSHELSQPCTVAGQGTYKCPICEVISPSSTEARRHMETHEGVKAFRCVICRYKGNTLRGMRTHIRMHADKISGDKNEEDFITCILEEDGMEIPPLNHTNHPSANHVETTQNYTCDQCNYSSTYKGNVVRHAKLVHSPGHSTSHSPVIGEGGESLMHNGHTQSKTPNDMSIIKTEPQDMIPDDIVEEIDEPSLIPETIIKVEINDQTESNTSSPDQMDFKLNKGIASFPPKTPSPSTTRILTPKSHSNVISVIQSRTSPQVSPPLDLNLLSPNGSKYCSTCDITFNYTNTFIAHKKFYCKANKVESSRPNSGPSPGSNTVVVTRGAETSVL